MSAGIIFMGTPDYAVPALTQLHQTYQILAVVTQPDKPAGRGRKLVHSPVKQAAQNAGLPVLQPPSLKDPDVVAQLRDLNPDVMVVAAFGQILRADVLNLPTFGCINLHASLLPRWRGAAPVAAAIKADDAKTGVTLMKMDEGLDTGPIICSRSIPISATHTRTSLTADLANLGADLLMETLPLWLANSITPQTQDDTLATYAPRIKKEEGLINWQLSAAEIERHIRAFDPWPGTFSHWEGARIKIQPAGVAPDWQGDHRPGTLFRLDKDIAVATGLGAIILRQIQPAGKRLMSAADFARGTTNFIGTQLR